MLTLSMISTTDSVKNSNKENWIYSAGGITFVKKVHGVLTMNLLEMLSFLVLIIVHHLRLAIRRRVFIAK